MLYVALCWSRQHQYLYWQWVLRQMLQVQNSVKIGLMCCFGNNDICKIQTTIYSIFYFLIREQMVFLTSPVVKAWVMATTCGYPWCNIELCARGSVHHSIIYKENPTRCNSVSNIFYLIFIWSSTCFGRHTAHHQKPKTALPASGFAYVVGCWTCSCWTLSASSNYTSNNFPRMQNQRLLVQF